MDEITTVFIYCISIIILAIVFSSKEIWLKHIAYKESQLEIEKAYTELERLDINPGEVIVSRGFDWEEIHAAFKRLCKIKGFDKNNRTMMIHLEGDATIKTMNEAEMNRAGWFRNENKNHVALNLHQIIDLIVSRASTSNCDQIIIFSGEKPVGYKMGLIQAIENDVVRRFGELKKYTEKHIPLLSGRNMYFFQESRKNWACFHGDVYIINDGCFKDLEKIQQISEAMSMHKYQSRYLIDLVVPHKDINKEGNKNA